ncbi:hypothetical protein Afil01_33370 [Actinorhabdospora filicis]|uniref:Diacylglycerol O-acyltransferase n=1 Tax=Actinorhabdospora filicis TaxID=1785913 RepID=A0A9W6WBA4_9ACTN|nr:WS/DGAT domain-containing protein [Actinorhabdospora filicis]GLZ78530.1 hypothetical protein Afil01_33370 [Actinorhabdospora filicis]
MPSTPLPLSPVDALFAVAGRAEAQFCVVARMEGPRPSREDLVALVDERWGDAGRLRLVLRGRRWHDSGEGSLEQHVHLGSEDARPDAVAALLDAPLAEERPRWRLVVLGGAGDWSLVLVVHHTLLDGLSARALLIRLLSRDLGDVPTTTTIATTGVVAALRYGLGAVARRPVAHRPVRRRHLALARVPLSALRRPSATVNDVFLAAVAGALGDGGSRWARVLVPVNVRACAELGNRVLPLEIRLPVETGDPARRLAEVARLTAPDVRARAVAGAERAMRWTLRAGRLALRLAEYMGMTRNAMTCSSMRPLPPGLRLGAARVVEAYFTTVHRRGLAVALTGASEDMTVSVVADVALAPLAERLASGIAAELTGAQNRAASG